MPFELSEISFGPFAPEDRSSLLESFEQSFGHPRDPDQWDWAFLKNPLGTQIFVAKEPTGRVVAQYAAIPRPFFAAPFGDLQCGEIVDAFVVPEYRQALRRDNLLMKICRLFVIHWGGFDRNTVMHGLPTPLHYRLGNKVMGYHLLHPMLLNARDLTTRAAPAAEIAGGSIQPLLRFDDECEALWRAIRGDYQLRGNRPKAYQNWRFFERPKVAYEAFSVQDQSGQRVGWFVLRHRWRDEAATAIADFCLDPAHPLAPAVIAWIEARAAAQGSTRAYAMFTPNSKEAVGLAHLGWQLEASEFRWVGETYEPNHLTLDPMRESFFVTLADFDIV